MGGTVHRAIMSPRERHRLDAINRRYPKRPFAGVGAIVFRGMEVLLVKRGRPPALGKWSIPGGLVELGESLGASVQREVMEEVGLDVRIDWRPNQAGCAACNARRPQAQSEVA